MINLSQATKTRAELLYHRIVEVIDTACGSRGFMEVCDAAIAFGMVGGRVESFNSLKYKFAYSDGDGGITTLKVRSYDPSGPFQNDPDINRFTATLYHGGRETGSHDRSYED